MSLIHALESDGGAAHYEDTGIHSGVRGAVLRSKHYAKNICKSSRTIMKDATKETLKQEAKGNSSFFVSEESNKDNRKAWMMGKIGKQLEKERKRAREVQQRLDALERAKKEMEEKEDAKTPSWFDDNKSALDDTWAQAKKGTGKEVSFHKLTL